ncbi:TonB-dependent receptor [Sphingomonas sabuli]|uniref:TonB-dependent receptor n=1 Tax=Sphingomonas sabuli TaxID=2764186 RepID=A0A7G9L3B7_9SPHN|nr:TonB-dependent receptor [Sphingomonas sabuli]QNM83116.1 TonB-dependent receptor [Sphingomonas sabuli]
MIALGASPAFAQAVPSAPVDQTPEKVAESEQIPPTSEQTDASGEPEANTPGTIVVTGSRIRRDNFSTPQNIDVLTRNDQLIAGARSTGETLQSGSVTSGTAQISGSFLGYLSEGGQGANTVGLRGLGSSRTLVLLNGRRLAPAGASSQLVSADLNVLPTSVVQRIEILREGASSIYGSDAIAGVINIITDTKVDGITLDAYADVPLEFGGGRTYRASVTAGKSFDRGYITVSGEYKKDEGIRLGDKDDWRCPRELAFINGNEVGQGSPDNPNELRCFPFERQGLGTARGYGLSYGLVPGSGFVFFGRRGLTNNDVTQGPLLVDNYDLRPLSASNVYNEHIFSPIQTWTGFLSTGYELGALGNAELYGEALYSRRTSHQDRGTQLSFQQITNSGEAQLYGGSYLGYPLDLFGLATSPFFPTSFIDAGINYFGPFIVPDRTIKQKQKVNFFRVNGGIRGDLGIGDFRYDLNAMVSQAKARESLQNPTVDRVNNILVAVEAPAGTPDNLITYAIPGQVGAGNGYTCAVNVDAAGNFIPGSTCVPINYTAPDIFMGGHFSDTLFNYLYPEQVNRTKYNQETFNAVIDGTLFALPAGEVKIALGAEYRHDFIRDVPAESRQNGTIYNYSTAGITKGSDEVKELFGEINIPLLKDRPFFETLEVDASARYTHYKSYGSDITYHVNAQWAPVRALRIRGNYGTNFRAPNLYEQYVADQVGFYGGGADPCDEFGTIYSPGTTVYENCLAELTPILDDPTTPENEALDFFTSTGIQVTTTGGKGNLEAEKAKTWGVGAVFNMPSHIADFSLAVDYFNIEVTGEVATLGNLILNFCYTGGPNGDLPFPNNPYCSFIDGRNPANVPNPGNISSFKNPYLNVARQIAEGIDFDARFAKDVFGGKFSTQLQATRMLHQQTEFFEGAGLSEFNGTLGYPGNGAGPKWVGSLDTRFTTANDITIRWGAEYVGKQVSTDSDIFLTSNGDVCNPAIPGNCILVDYDLTAEAYWEHGLSVQWAFPQLGQVTMGVNNIFNAKPPTIAAHPNRADPRVGNYFANGPYDYRGRSFFVNVTRSFK